MTQQSYMAGQGCPHHPDLLDDEQAIHYLRLNAVTADMPAAKRLLSRLVGQGAIHPIKWSKEYLYARPDLDAMVEREIANLRAASDCSTEGKAAHGAANTEYPVMAHKNGTPQRARTEPN